MVHDDLVKGASAAAPVAAPSRPGPTAVEPRGPGRPHQFDAAEPARGHDRPRLPHQPVGAQVEPHGERAVAAVGRRPDRQSVLPGHRDRLLQVDVLARLESRDRDLGVERGRDADGDHVDPWIAHEGIRVGVGADPREGPHDDGEALRVRVGRRDGTKAGDPRHRGQVKRRGRAATADEADAERRRHPADPLPAAGPARPPERQDPERPNPPIVERSPPSGSHVEMVQRDARRRGDPPGRRISGCASAVAGVRVRVASGVPRVAPGLRLRHRKPRRPAAPLGRL